VAGELEQNCGIESAAEGDSDGLGLCRKHNARQNRFQRARECGVRIDGDGLSQRG